MNLYLGTDAKMHLGHCGIVISTKSTRNERKEYEWNGLLLQRTNRDVNSEEFICRSVGCNFYDTR